MADAAASSIAGSVETPFLDHYAAETAEPEPVLARRQSPFLQEYDGEEGAPADAFAEMQAEVLAELEDDELDEAFHALVDEVSEVQARLPQGAQSEAYREQALRQHLAPLQQSVDALIDAAEARADAVDLGPQTESEVEELFEALDVDAPLPSVAFEAFWKGLKRKIKKVARVAKAVAKRGVALAAGPLLRAALGKLRAIVRPLLDKVLKLALDKIPPAYRPLAEKVAARLGIRPALQASVSPIAMAVPIASASSDAAMHAAAAHDAPGTDSELAGDAEPSAEPAAPDVSMLQGELDLRLSEALLVPDALAHEASSVELEAAPARDPFADLELARERFVREVLAAEDPSEAGEIVERFLPAITLALRTGIRLAGRPRVVSFLGGLIGKLIGPFVGKAAAPALGRVVADLGLRTVLQAELGDEDARVVAAESLAAVVEGTVQRLAHVSPEALESPDLGEALMHEAFEAASAAVLPASTIRPDLRESEEGGWVALPLRGRKRYRKHTRVIHAVITPQTAAAISTYGGGTLADFLRDRLHLSPARPIEARVHLYEAVPHTRLARIAQSEAVTGMGASDSSAWSQLHPLTPDAAALLVGSPAMGRPFDDEADPRRPMIGERYYFLEIAGAPARPLGRQSHLHFTVDVPRREVRACIYLSEVVAQRLAAAIRKGEPAARQLAMLRAIFAGARRRIGARGLRRRVRIVTGAMRGTPQVLGARARMMRRQLEPQLVGWTWEPLRELLASRAKDLVAAAEAPHDGVRIQLRFGVPELAAHARAGIGQAALPARLLPVRAPGARADVASGVGHD